MIKILLPFFILVSQCLKVYCQGFELIGVMDGRIVIIDSLTGQAIPYQDLPGLPNVADLSYHESNRLYYSLMNTSNSPSLVSVSVDGEFEEIGPLTINGNQIQLAEALAYNATNNKLYAGVSLNGGTSTNDFFSESIVEVDPATGECIFITEILTNHTNADIDVMTFSGTDLIIADGAPPSADFLSIYKLNFQGLGSVTSLEPEYESTYLPIRDFSAIGTNIYFTEERNLHRYIQSSHTIELIGITHRPDEFNGEIIQGISKLTPCDLPEADLGEDRSICESQTYLLDATNSNASYTWQDGSSNSTFLVSGPGIYWVTVENSCGRTTDSISIDYVEIPMINLGEDQTLCNANSIILDAGPFTGSYEWIDGSNSSTLEVSQSGTYWVELENSCGIARDTVEVIFPEFMNLDIPNVFTPNRDGVNDYFIIDSRLLGSSLKVFQRTGIKVYESKNYQNDWDGGDLPTGVYYWLIVNNCGSNYKGWVSILY